MGYLRKVIGWAKGLKSDVLIVYFAALDPRTPMLPRILAVATAAYVISPIDLIPDFIPVLGYLDDLVIIPAAIWLVFKLIPSAVLASAQQKTAALLKKPKRFITAAVIIVVCLLLTVAAAVWWINR